MPLQPGSRLGAYEIAAVRGRQADANHGGIAGANQ